MNPLAEFLNLFKLHFDRAEIKELYFVLQLDDEEAPGERKSKLIVYSMKQCGQQGRLQELAQLCRERRPTIAWPELPDSLTLTDERWQDVDLNAYKDWVAQNPLYNTLQILGMPQPRPLGEIYTDVYLLNQQRYLEQAELVEREQQFAKREDHSRDKERREGVKVLEQEKRVFIVGQPGAGKTTFLRWLAVNAAKGDLPIAKKPIYVPLRAWNDFAGSFWEFLAEPLVLSGFGSDAVAFLRELLRAGEGLLLLDGLDEVLQERRQPLFQGIDGLVQLGRDSHVIVTCRPHAEGRIFQGFAYAQMADFAPEQVQAFVQNWFGQQEKEKADNLWQALNKPENKSISELTRTPLLLGLLCITYQKTGKFPTKRHELYEKALDVVLETWDGERGVQRDSTYGRLQLHHKRELLAFLAFNTFELGQSFIPQQRLTELVREFLSSLWQREVTHLREIYQGSVPDFEYQALPKRDARPDKVLRDVAAQHGLLLTQTEGVYSYSHLTLQGVQLKKMTPDKTRK